MPMVLDRSLLICVFHDISLSIWTPSIFKLSLASRLNFLPFSVEETVSRFPLYFVGVNTISSVFDGLLIRELLLYQFSALSISCSAFCLTESIDFPVIMNWVSSAYETTLASGKEFVSSFVKQRKSIGPSIDPWGTPLVTRLSSDVTFLKRVFCFRDCRYDLTQDTA